MNQSICDEKHRNVDEKFKTHERRLNNHSERLDSLEQYRSEAKTEIKNLCQQIKSLVKTMRWFIGLMVGAFVSFFFYAVQAGLFK
jgi:chromosome segregation ATPase